MATYETKGRLTYKDENSDNHIIYPVTKMDCIEDMPDIEKEVAESVAAYLEENPVETPDITAQVERAEAAATTAEAAKESVNTSVNLAGGYASSASSYAVRAENAATRAEEAAASIPESGGGTVKTVNGVAPDENGNVQITIPDSGGNADYVGVEPAEDDMPKVFITGDKPTTKDDLLAEMEYISKTDIFHAFLIIKCQGTSSMNYPKKNFTVKLYNDETRETKLEKDFKDWNHPGNKFVLKANYIDHSHARNIISARLWGEVVASRPDYNSLPVEMRNSPNNGAVDGFPIKVYYNGTYEGVYTWNIGKDDWQWGMDEDNPNHVLLCAETNDEGRGYTSACNFRELWDGVDESDWSVEVGTNSTALKASLNNLIQFVMDNDGDAFRNGIGQYLDIQSAIDYYIFQYEICGLDGLAKNMLLATYDGTKWICGAYDMDSTFGLFWDGSRIVSAEYACPEDYQETSSLLWERIEANFLPELKARQAELRKTVLSYANIVTHFERFTDTIGNDLYAEDLTVYGGIPSASTNNIKQIRNFVRDRQAYVSAEFAAMSEPVSCTGISLNKSSLSFTEEGTQTLVATVTPDGCTDVVKWVSSNTSVATVNGGMVTAIANGNATITVTCGNYSATCNVSVSGLYEAIPCTGITLDKESLTFTEIGSQTLIATVTPGNTTDSVIWSSTNESVAIVNNGVVTVIGNGSATIRATCGNHSATCAVSVSGIVNLYSLAEETEFDGASTYIDTGVKLYDADKDYSITMEYTPSGTNTSNKALLHCMHEDTSQLGMKLAVSYGNTNGKYRHNLFANSSSIVQEDMLDHNVDSTQMGNTWKWIGISHNAAAKTYVTARYDGSNVYCGEITADYYNITESLLIGCGQDKNGAKNNFWSGTVHDCKVLNKANTVAEMFEHCGFHDMYPSVVWSDTAEYDLENKAHLTGNISGNVISGGCYVTPERIAVPEGATKMAIYNMPNVKFATFKIVEYGDTTGNALKENKEASANSKNLMVTLQEGTKFVRLAALALNSANNVTYTDPENNIGVMWL